MASSSSATASAPTGMSPAAAAHYARHWAEHKSDFVPAGAGEMYARFAVREAIFDAYLSGEYMDRKLSDEERNALVPRYYAVDDEGKEVVLVPKDYAQKWRARQAAAAKAAAPPQEKPMRKRPMSNAETRAAFAAAGPCFVKPGEPSFKLPRVKLPAAPSAPSASQGEMDAHGKAVAALRWYATVRAERGWDTSREDRPKYDAARAAAEEAMESLVARLDADHN
jgi:hypothetical protein